MVSNSKAGYRYANYPLPIRGGVDENYSCRPLKLSSIIGMSELEILLKGPI